MLRISDVSSPDGTVTCLEGRLTAQWAAAVLAAGRTRKALDLRWVTSVDREGLAVLAELTRSGVRLLSVPRFVTSQLEGEVP
jgi:ABC-type transporter Mla MlaB component